MDAQLKEAKQAIRQFMRDHYTDERLAMLLAHARDGKLEFSSCCCFIGVVTADHAMQSLCVYELSEVGVDTSHLDAARLLPGALEAEEAFRTLLRVGIPHRILCGPYRPFVKETRDMSRRRLISIILAEMRRRERERYLPANTWDMSEAVSVVVSK